MILVLRRCFATISSLLPRKSGFYLRCHVCLELPMICICLGPPGAPCQVNRKLYTLPVNKPYLSSESGLDRGCVLTWDHTPSMDGLQNITNKRQYRKKEMRKKYRDYFICRCLSICTANTHVVTVRDRGCIQYN